MVAPRLLVDMGAMQSSPWKQVISANPHQAQHLSINKDYVHKMGGLTPEQGHSKRSEIYVE